MPKCSLAKIRLYLKEGKTLSDGSSPIMLMCSFNGRKEVSTSCSCIPKYWDKRNECVKKGYPNWLMINSMMRIARLNVENNDNIPLIDLDCRYYSYRHSYIMAQIQKPNVNLLALAQSVGKSSHTLHQYISLLGDVDLI